MTSEGYDGTPRVYDDFIEKDFEQYRPNQQLTLHPHKPHPPYGPAFYGGYPKGMDVEELGFDGESAKKSRTERVRDYRPTRDHRPTGYVSSQHKKKSPVTATVLKSLSGGDDKGPQVLLCKTRSLSPHASNLFTPEVVVVVKIYDPLFYPWEYDPFGPPWIETIVADVDYTREAAAYEKLREKELHDKPHLAPKYYGAYTVQLQMRNPKVQAEKKTRHVGAIILEYVEGHRMSDLCDTDWDGNLLPKSDPELAITEKYRLKVLEVLLDGYVQQLYRGVEQCYIEPRHILISKNNGDKTPRVTLLDYTASVVDDKREKPRNLYKGWYHPPHPFTRFGPRKLVHLAGWFPTAWLEHPEDMDQWLRSVFGNDVNSAKYTVELEGQIMPQTLPLTEDTEPTVSAKIRESMKESMKRVIRPRASVIFRSSGGHGTEGETSREEPVV